MAAYALALRDYIKTDTFGRDYIIDDRIRDKDFRKKLIRDSLLGEAIDEMEKCQLDKYEILEDTTNKIRRTKFYGFLPCFARDKSLYEEIYYSSTIPYIYHLKHLEFINDYKGEERLSLMKLIYPAKMPTKDYFPFIEFDLGTKIPLVLTEDEKQRYKESLNSFSNYDINSYSWCYCILWIDSNRMYMSLFDEDYYFKQVGKNVHLFRLVSPD